MTKQDIAYQAALLFIIGAVMYLIAVTTQENLARLGVDSSIDFLWKRAGFEIGQALIPFDAESTIARAFAVALLNTLVLAAVSIVCASVLGVIIGLARLSDNWLVSRLATAYIEIFRNIPSLLQIFFWYFVVLRTLPRSDESIEFFNCIFLNNRGLFVPAASLGQGWTWIVAALLLGWALIYFLRKQERRRNAAPGFTRAESTETNPLASWNLLILAGIVGAVILAARRTLAGPAGDPLRLPRGDCHDARVPLPGSGPCPCITPTYIGEIVRSGFTSFAAGADRSGRFAGFAPPPYHQADPVPPGVTRHHPATDDRLP